VFSDADRCRPLQHPLHKQNPPYNTLATDDPMHAELPLATSNRGQQVMESFFQGLGHSSLSVGCHLAAGHRVEMHNRSGNNFSYQFYADTVDLCPSNFVPQIHDNLAWISLQNVMALCGRQPAFRNCSSLVIAVFPVINRCQCNRSINQSQSGSLDRLSITQSF
jgi:hypothetical protein